ncbi:MAG: hypothetical protein ACYSR6_01455 [Planctomycetota bacterium]|jgi:hypothetical protein
MRVMNKEELRIIRGGSWLQCMDSCMTMAELLTERGELDGDRGADARDCLEFCQNQ